MAPSRQGVSCLLTQPGVLTAGWWAGRSDWDSCPKRPKTCWGGMQLTWLVGMYICCLCGLQSGSWLQQIPPRIHKALIDGEECSARPDLTASGSSYNKLLGFLWAQVFSPAPPAGNTIHGSCFGAGGGAARADVAWAVSGPGSSPSARPPGAARPKLMDGETNEPLGSWGSRRRFEAPSASKAKQGWDGGEASEADSSDIGALVQVVMLLFVFFWPYSIRACWD